MFQNFKSVAAILTVISGAVAQNAFEGAIGFGAVSTGGNGETVVTVTNLDDSGAGSFRDAVSESNRIINFDVAGYIFLESPVSLSSHITINGQTAPSPGIGVMAGEISASGRNNIVIRNFRMRQGNLDEQTGKRAFNMGESSNIILDHCSIAYGQWDSIDAVKAENITISNTIIAFPIGQQFGAHIEGGPATLYGNLWVSGHNRQPLAKSNTQYINNIIYNYQAAYTAAETSGYFSHDILNNYFITGPSTTNPSNYYYQMNNRQSVYAHGNYADTENDGILAGALENKVGSAVVLEEPWDPTSVGIAKLTALEAYTEVLANAGASPRDEVDVFAVSTVQTLGEEGVIYTNQASTGLSNGGYGTL